MRLDAERLRKLRRSLWALLAVVTLISVAASIITAINYTDIVYTKLAVDAGASMNVSASGLGPTGEVLNTTVFTLGVTVYVDDPGSRQVELQVITYRLTVRDYLYEDQMGANGSWVSYFSVVVKNQSYGQGAGLVNPGENRSFQVPPTGGRWTLDADSNPSTFTGLKNILNYAHIHKGYAWNESEWDHTFIFALILTGIPMDYSGPSSGYLIELPVVRRSQTIVLGGGR